MECNHGIYPDDYLSQKTQGTESQSTGFNPDEYLKAKSPETLGDVAGQAVLKSNTFIR